jgi:hypothetical protein
VVPHAGRFGTASVQRLIVQAMDDPDVAAEVERQIRKSPHAFLKRTFTLTTEQKRRLVSMPRDLADVVARACLVPLQSAGTLHFEINETSDPTKMGVRIECACTCQPDGTVIECSSKIVVSCRAP